MSHGSHCERRDVVQGYARLALYRVGAAMIGVLTRPRPGAALALLRTVLGRQWPMS